MGALNVRRMWGYLAISPGSMTFTELPLNDLKDRERFVGGSLERIQLAENIDIWVNEDYLSNANIENLSILIQNGEDLRPLLGKSFLATTDQDGHCVPLSDNQVKWLNAHLRTGIRKNLEFYKIIDLQAAPLENAGVGK